MQQSTAERALALDRDYTLHHHGTLASTSLVEASSPADNTICLLPRVKIEGNNKFQANVDGKEDVIFIPIQLHGPESCPQSMGAIQSGMNFPFHWTDGWLFSLDSSLDCPQ